MAKNQNSGGGDASSSTGWGEVGVAGENVTSKQCIFRESGGRGATDGKMEGGGGGGGYRK